ncbi:MAG: hypothetical protein P8N68_06895, partial [Paracoccaceae bacterium]|nr:hypothetical protein [Paracoccaceae bacterium]
RKFGPEATDGQVQPEADMLTLVFETSPVLHEGRQPDPFCGTVGALNRVARAVFASTRAACDTYGLCSAIARGLWYSTTIAKFIRTEDIDS